MSDPTNPIEPPATIQDQPRTAMVQNSSQCVTFSNFEAQIATESAPPLTLRQRAALQLLLQGWTNAAVARKLQLHRNTIHRWQHENPRFIQILEHTRAQAAAEALNLLRASLLTGAHRLHAVLENGDPIDAIRAFKVLLAPNVLKRLNPPSDPL